MRRYLIAVVVALNFPADAQVREPIVGLPCEGCEAVFEGRPSTIPERSRLTTVTQPGQPLVLVGKVTDSKGKPVSGVVVYAYQTNAEGIYPTDDRMRGMASHRHGTLRGWARTNENGNYAFDTVRPGGYPGTALPQHIHMHVIEPGCATYYIDDVMFNDDPRLTEEQVRKLTLNRGGNGISTPRRLDGTWYVRRDIVLGRNIPGYRSCPRPAT